MNTTSKITYKDAGVDIDKANKIVGKINPFLSAGSNLSGFVGNFKLNGINNPVLVSSCDGVGTKLKIAIMMNKFDTIGIDLVAMSINDIATSCAKPLFFLDYISMGCLDEDTVFQLIKGINKGCYLSGCTLLGGETAEMPDIYANGDFDLAGFAVGAVQEDKIPNSKTIKADDVIVGIHSNGIHSNGFSLCRKLFFNMMNYSIDKYMPEFSGTLGEELLKPTLIYSNFVLNLSEKLQIKGLAHITGGGILENLPRVLPPHTEALIRTDAFPQMGVFEMIKHTSSLDNLEMFRVFNMGIGFAVVISSEDVDQVLKTSVECGFKASIIGSILSSECEKPCVRLI